MPCRTETSGAPGKNMFQSSMSLGRMIQEINAVLTQQAPDGLTYLHRLS